MKSPVVMIVFNRPDTTRKVFEAVRSARPPKLVVVADGPRPDRPDDVEKVRATRAVFDEVDWPCELVKDFSEENLGCGRRPATGITNAFEHCEQAIILEDDCLPHPTFFPFCDELLDYYRDDERVMTISGDNFQFGRKRTRASYYFSVYPSMWGWATWKRAWQHYDYYLSDWIERRDTTWLADVLGDKVQAAFWRHKFDSWPQFREHAWDYQWIYCHWKHGATAIIPAMNLVGNVGWGGESTHTDLTDSHLNAVPVSAMPFPMRHPERLEPNTEADLFVFLHVHKHRPLRWTRRWLRQQIGSNRLVASVRRFFVRYPRLLPCSLWARLLKR